MRAYPRLRLWHQSTLEGLVAAAARGFFLWPNSGCNTMRYGADPESCRGGCLKRAAALGFVFNWQKCMDSAVLEEGIRRAVGTEAELDTLTLTQQPPGGGSTRFGIEILDARHLQGNPRFCKPSCPRKRDYHEARSPELPPLFTSADSPRAACERVPTWGTCAACAGSKLEHYCKHRDVQPGCRWKGASRKPSARCGGFRRLLQEEA